MVSKVQLRRRGYRLESSTGRRQDADHAQALPSNLWHLAWVVKLLEFCTSVSEGVADAWYGKAGEIRGGASGETERSRDSQPSLSLWIPVY